MRHYPLTCRQLSLPQLDWPDSADLRGPSEPQLFWLAAGCAPAHPALAQLTLRPQGEPTQGEPGEGTVLENPGEEAWVPVWLVEHENGSWWAVDGTSGQTCGGSLQAHPGPALGRLLFCCGTALMLSFLGSSVVFYLLAMVGNIVPLAAGEGLGKALSLAFGLIAIGALTIRLNAVLPCLLADPVERAQTGQLRLPLRDDWLGLLQASSTLMGLFAFLGVLGCLAGSLSGRGNMGLLFLQITQTVLCGYLALKCRGLSGGRPFLTTEALVPTGPVGELVTVGLRIVLFAIAGQLAGGLVAVAGFVPRWDMAGLTLQGAQLGALLGVATASLAGRERAQLLAGLVAKSVGEFLMGGWLALLLALLAVATPGVVAAMSSTGEGRRRVFWDALQQSWAFSLGLVSGRLVGRVLGLFFLGLGGLAVGEALAEQLAASAALMSQRRAVPAA